MTKTIFCVGFSGPGVLLLFEEVRRGDSQFKSEEKEAEEE